MVGCFSISLSVVVSNTVISDSGKIETHGNHDGEKKSQEEPFDPKLFCVVEAFLLDNDAIMTRYQLSLEAENLPRRVFFGCMRNPNPYAVVKVSGGPHEGTVVGRTEPIPATLQPDWTECLFVDTGE